MKLYNADLSPFAARVRVAVRHKGLTVEFVPPPEGGLKGEAYLALNPLGKLPTLVLPSGATVPESETILEYLEDAHPTPALLPKDAEARARVRLLARIGDIYVSAALGPLFGQMNPKTRNAEIVETEMTNLDKGLRWLDHYIAGGKYAAGDTASLADCSLVPILFWVDLMGQTFGRPDVMSKHAKVAAYWAATQADPVHAEVCRERQTALAAFMSRPQA